MEQRDIDGDKGRRSCTGCFVNGNRNGNNVCAVPGGLDHGGTVTAALWAATGTTDTIYSACTCILLWFPRHQGPQGLW